MPKTLQYSLGIVPGNEETAPAISHYNFHRVHGAQIAVLLSGTRRKPVLIRRKPVESRSVIPKDRFFRTFWKSSIFANP